LLRIETTTEGSDKASIRPYTNNINKSEIFLCYSNLYRGITTECSLQPCTNQGFKQELLFHGTEVTSGKKRETKRALVFTRLAIIGSEDGFLTPIIGVLCFLVTAGLEL
jgi:hypothetical protein